MSVELVKYIIDQLVENKDAVRIAQEEDNIKVVVDKADMGKVIGKQGRIAKAIRILVKAAGAKDNSRLNVDISESEEA